MSKSPKHMVSLISVIGAATALTYIFWSDLWHGGGPIGGDLYTYFFPQKQFLAEQLSRGAFPLGNPLVGHGYPLIAESQTGPFYVFNLIFYRFLDVNTAYSIVQLLHYILAFVFTWMFARRLELSYWGAGLAALVSGIESSVLFHILLNADTRPVAPPDQRRTCQPFSRRFLLCQST